MNRRSWRWLRRSAWLPVVLALCLTLPKLWQGDFNVDTGRYAAISLQAWSSAADGDLGALLTLKGRGGPEGVDYFNKPPLVFWLHGPVLLASGPSLWAARLPGVAAVLLAVWGVWWCGSRGAGRRAGVLAGCVLATTYAFTSLSHAISPDLWQAAFLMLALVPVVGAVRANRGRWLILCGVGVGLALLVKPLVALIVPVILAAWLMWERRWRWLGWLGAAVLVALLISAPWHVAMAAWHGDAFLDQYFGREVVSRAAGGLDNVNPGAGSPFYYLRQILETYWPWLVGLVPALVWAAGRGVPRRWRPWVRLALVWTVVWLVALSVHPDKRTRYLAPVLPVWAWLIGMWLASVRGRKWRELIDGALRVAAPVGVAAAVLVSVLPVRVHGGTPRHWREFLAWHEEAGRPELWEGGFGLPESSRLYLEGRGWPRPTHDGLGLLIEAPPRGALIVYHHRHPIQPGHGEEVVFRSHNGDVVVTRLVGEWEGSKAAKQQTSK